MKKCRFFSLILSMAFLLSNTCFAADNPASQSDTHDSGTLASPRLTVRTLDHYDVSKVIEENEAFYIAEFTGDNTNGTKPLPLDVKLTSDTTVRAELTINGSYTTSAEVELELIKGKTELEAGVSLTTSVTYSKGLELHSTAYVDPGDSYGGVIIYNKGYYSDGALVYKLFDSTSNEIWYDYLPAGALMPIENAFHAVTV